MKVMFKNLLIVSFILNNKIIQIKIQTNVINKTIVNEQDYKIIF